MDNYSKGSLFNIKDVQHKEINIDIFNDLLLTTNKYFIHFIEKIYKYLEKRERDILSNYVKKHTNVLEALYIFKKYINLFDFDIPYIKEIFFEIIRDSEDNFYGKELITGRIFPIIQKDISLSKCETHSKPYYVSYSDGVILTTFDKSKRYSSKVIYESPLIDSYGKVYNIKEKNGKLLAINKTSQIIVERKLGETDIIDLNINSHSNNLSKGFIYLDYSKDITANELLDYYNRNKYCSHGHKFEKLINQLADKNIYIKSLYYEHSNGMILKIYTNDISDTELDYYVKSLCYKELNNLKDGNYYDCELTIKDIDKIVELVRLRNLDYTYYISFLYILCLFNQNHLYNTNNSYISDYVNDIMVLLNRLKKDNIISDISVDSIKEIIKVKKLV